MAKSIAPPDVAVHLLRDVTNKEVTTRCGLSVKKGTLRVTVWASDITCEQCRR